MNQKELKEIRRRFNPEKDSISHIYGCYVNSSKEIVTTIDMSLGMMEQDEAEMYLKLLKKSISGSLGRNLIDMPFSTAQVENSDEHRLLQALRLSHLKDENMREVMYRRIIENLDMGENSYVILMAADSYDVPFKGGDDEIFDEGSNEVFDYIVCGICPVKDAKSNLKYASEEKTFRSASTGHIIGTPQIGFLFPAFDGRCANIYNALYYSRDILEIHEELIKGIFNLEEIPMSAGAQINAFGGVLEESLGSDCKLEVIQAVHGEIREKLLIHKENKEIELPEIYVEEVSDILRKNGVPQEKIASFNEACRKEMGDSGVLNPSNLIETKKFEMSTGTVKITVDPDYASSIRYCEIDGINYILVPAGEGVTVNGIDVNMKE